MSEIASCHSLKSVALNLIAGEVGFIGVSPSHAEKTYNDFLGFIETIKGKVQEEDFEDPYCNFAHHGPSGLVCKNFDVDYRRDLAYLTEIAKKNNAILSLMPSVDSMAVSMCVNNIYGSIGVIMNNDDDYFEVIRELWGTLDKSSKNYELLVEHKIEGLKRCLSLSETRIQELLEI